MTILTSGPNPGIADIVLSEGDESYSRDNAVVTQAATVALRSGQILTKSGAKYVKYVGGATGADAILINNLPAIVAGGDAKAAVIVRMAEVNATALVGLDANAIAKLALVGIVVRSSTGLAGTY